MNLNSPKQSECPSCHTMLPVYDGYPTWCHTCHHNLNPIPGVPETNTNTIWDLSYKKLNQKLGFSLFQKVMSHHPESLTRGASSWFVHLFSITILLANLSFLGMSIYFFSVQPFSFFSVSIGLLFLMLAYVFRYRIPKLEKGERLLTSKELPHFFALLHSLCKQIGSKPVDGVVLTGDYNASIGSIGFRRKTVLRIGVPLFNGLSPQEKIALLSHEIGHVVNKDLVRGFYVGTALHTLATWYHILHPGTNEEEISMFEYINQYIMIGLAQVPKWLFFTLLYLVFHDSQRSEYYADYISAKTAGTKNTITLLQTIHYDYLYPFAIQKATVTRLSLFNLFAQILTEMPEREKLRVKTLIQREEPSIDSTHPPTNLRTQYVEQFPLLQPQFIMSVQEEKKIMDELHPYYSSIERDVIDWYRYFTQ